eukprot:2911916-Rhodomonas_salina.1
MHYPVQISCISLQYCSFSAYALAMRSPLLSLHMLLPELRDASAPLLACLALLTVRYFIHLSL